MKKVFIILLLLTGLVSMSRGNDDVSYKHKLLQQIETAGEDTVRFKLMFELVRLTMIEPDECIKYADMMIREAEAKRNTRYMCEGYLFRMYLAYNMLDADEVYKWMTLLEPLARNDKYYDLLFGGKQAVVDFFMLSEDYEKQEQEARKIMQEAKELKSDYGIMVAHVCLSNAYMMTFRPGLAAEELEKSYEIAVKLDQKNKQLEILYSMSVAYQTIDDKKNWYRSLKLQEDVAFDVIDDNPEMSEYRKDNVLMAYLSFVQYYIAVDDKQMATEYVNMAEKYFLPTYPKMYVVYYHRQRHEYFMYMGMYEQALASIDSVLGLMESVYETDYYKYLSDKACTLSKMGRSAEAVDLYQKSLQYKDSLNVVVMSKQIDHIRRNYDADRLMLEQENIRNYMHKASLFAIVIVLGVLLWFIVHTLRVRKHLGRAEREMRRMSEDMEKANVAKDHFLSNISQSISGPLNSIVDGSLMLASDSDVPQEERVRVSDDIRKTSDELMQVVNNILDLSRLEAGMMKFGVTPVSVITLIRDAVHDVTCHKGANIEAVIPDTDKYVLRTDIDRITAAFKSVLAPAQGVDVVSVKVDVINRDTELRMLVYGSRLAVSESSQDVIIRNEINRMLVNRFGGFYEILVDEHTGGRYVRMVFPVEVE